MQIREFKFYFKKEKQKKFVMSSFLSFKFKIKWT